MEQGARIEQGAKVLKKMGEKILKRTEKSAAVHDRYKKMKASIGLSSSIT